MKFLCGNCKAKYQIADEKVSGRTLRMKCRRCGHDILIDGHSMPQSAPSSPAPAPRRAGTSTVSVMPGPGRAGTGSHAMPSRPATAQAMPRPAPSRSKPPSGLSADFRRHVAAPPEVPQRTTAPYDLWHAAIQDVPVGPMTRDELARKIDAGAVTPESLCWREGMDDWRPLGDLPELAQLLRRTREPARGMRGRPPPSVPGALHSGSRSAPLPLPSGDEYEEDGAEPTRITDFMPSLALAPPPPRMPPQQPAPQVQPSETSPKVVLPLVSAAQPMDVSAHLPAPAPKSNTGLVTGIAVGLLLGIVLIAGPMMYRSFWGGEQAAPGPQHPAATIAAPAPSAAPPRGTPEPSAPVEIAETETKSTPRTVQRAPIAPKTPKPEPAKPGTKVMTEEERIRWERLRAENDIGGLAELPKNGAGERDTSGPVAASLTPTQLSKVVQQNKQQLQRCYETALRAAGGKQDAAIKIKVNVVIGSSGKTKSVTTQGDGLGNMTDCIKSSVKRWVFPPSSGEPEFEFPLVFQPGA